MRIPARVLIGSLACLIAVAGLGCQPPAKPRSSAKTTPSGPMTIEPSKPAPAVETKPEPKPETKSEPKPEPEPEPKPEPKPEPAPETKNDMSIEKTAFGKTADGQAVDLYTIKNKNGLVLKTITFGATVIDVETPDKDGKLANITLSFPKLEGYTQRHPYFGSTVGRYGNRIAKGKFKIGDEEYTLATNNDVNHLHGGKVGFDAVIWKAEEVKTDNSTGVKFSYTSADGEEGYPGKLETTVTYSLTNDDTLVIDYTAKAVDKPTVVNLTNHCYWNLGGAGSGDVLKHELMIAADKYLPIDASSIPTGELADVAGTALDFTKSKPIGAQIDELKKEPHTTKGYDHCFVLRGQGGALELAAKVKDPASGRVMEILTTEPGIQLYCGNFLDGSEGNGGFKQHEAFCLETQHYPDSPNQSSFPTTLVKPGDTYISKTVHKFSVEK
ncbi:MAG TPA: aldose epimerase family protein [Pirellulaceae bacterium]|nr:aldose epimerase family protein [Pirellulaceae bacterium]